MLRQIWSAGTFGPIPRWSLRCVCAHAHNTRDSISFPSYTLVHVSISCSRTTVSKRIFSLVESGLRISPKTFVGARPLFKVISIREERPQQEVISDWGVYTQNYHVRERCDWSSQHGWGGNGRRGSCATEVAVCLAYILRRAA